MNDALLKIVTDHMAEVNWLYRKDLDALAAHLTKSPATGARSAADITWEVILNNRRAAKRVRGEDPGPTVGFPACPDELASPEALGKELKESCDELVAAIGDDPMRAVEYPGGSEPALQYVEFIIHHMMYHLGQLNYIQVLFGDGEVHWS